MKIIQTFWSKPFREAEHKKGLQQASGWCNPLYYYMSHALSCLSLRQFYDDVELYTDPAGKRLLIDELQLPYTAVHLLPEELDSCPSELWAIGKIFAYRDQQEPFLHVDNDVFIWQRFPDTIVQAPLVAQNYERDITFNRANVMNVMMIANDIPPYMQHMKSTDEANVGIFGGTDTDFIRRYADEALRFATANVNKLKRLKYHYYFNTVFEQYLLTCLAASESREITYAFHDVDDHFSQMVRFNQVPSPQWYIHPCGPWKWAWWVGDAVARCLHDRFPEAYRKVMDWYGQQTAAAVAAALPGQHHKERHVTGKAPCLSVIIPAYQMETLVGHCLQTMLAQTYKDMEVIVIDDGSTDTTAQRVAELAAVDRRVRLLRQTHRGVAAARNKGLAEARGELIAFVDADDYIHPQYLELMVQALDSHPEADMAMTNSIRTKKLTDEALSRHYDDETAAVGEGAIVRRALFMGYRKLSFEQFHTCHGKLFRRRLLEGLSFPEEYTMYEDAVMMNRVYQRVSKCVQVGHRLYFWLNHPSSALATSAAGRLQGAAAYRQCLSDTPRRDSMVRAACLQRIFLHSAWIRSLMDAGEYADLSRKERRAAIHIPFRVRMEYWLSRHITAKKKWQTWCFLHSKRARKGLQT